MKNRRQTKLSLFYFLITVVILTGIFALWTTRLSKPYIGRHDNNSAWVHITGRNYLRQGYSNIALGQVMNVDQQNSADLYYYQHHPPLVSLLASFSIALIGDNEASTRLVPIFLTMIATAALFATMRIGYRAEIAQLSILLFLTTPMIAFYGQMANHEPITLAFLMLASLFYLKYLKRSSLMFLTAMASCVALSVWAGWPALFFAVGLCIHASFLAPTQRQAVISTVIGTVAVSLALWFLLSFLQSNSFAKDLWNAYIIRSGNTNFISFGRLLQWLKKLVWGQIRIRYTEALPLLATMGGIILIHNFRKASPRQKQVDGLIGVWVLMAALHIIVFRQGAEIHDYWSYYFAVPMAALGALGIVNLIHRAQNHNLKHRWLAGITLSILLAGLIASDIRWISTLYNEHDNLPTLLAPAIKERIPPGQPLKYQPDWWPAIWYYSERDFVGQTIASHYDSPDVMRLECLRTTNTKNNETLRFEDWTCEFYAQ